MKLIGINQQWEDSGMGMIYIYMIIAIKLQKIHQTWEIQPVHLKFLMLKNQ